MAKESPNMFTEDFFNSNYEKGLKMVKGFFVMTADMVKNCALVARKYCSEDVASRLEAFQPKVTSVMEAYLTGKWPLVTLTHGDAWYNNFMYK